MGTTRINTVIDDRLLAVTKHFAVMRAVSVSDIVRTALKHYIVQQIKQEQADNALLAQKHNEITDDATTEADPS